MLSVLNLDKVELRLLDIPKFLMMRYDNKSYILKKSGWYK